MHFTLLNESLSTSSSLPTPIPLASRLLLLLLLLLSMRLTLSLHGAVTVAVTDKATQLKEAGHEIISLSVGASAEHEQLHTQTLARFKPP